MISENENIELKPQFIYWIGKNLIPLCFVFGMIAIVANIQPIDFRINVFIGIVIMLLVVIIFFNYIKLLFCTSWTITEEQIKIEEGVFSKDINYIEIYRIIDYEEKQSIWQRIFNNTTLYIYSTDKSHPKLAIIGIKKDVSIMQEIRNRVEIQRKVKNIKEFSNL